MEVQTARSGVTMSGRESEIERKWLVKVEISRRKRRGSLRRRNAGV
jgi:hypothetical protein